MLNQTSFVMICTTLFFKHLLNLLNLILLLRGAAFRQVLVEDVRALRPSARTATQCSLDVERRELPPEEEQALVKKTKLHLTQYGQKFQSKI